jgi:hypothetical protein
MWHVSEAQKRVFDVWFSVATLVAAVVGGLFSLREYVDSKERDRVANTLQYVSRFESEPLLSDQRQIDKAIDEVEARYEQAHTAGLSHPQKKALADQLRIAVIRGDDKTAQSVDRLKDFFTQAAICSENKVCSGRYIQTVLGHDGRDFFGFVRPYLCAAAAHYHDPDPAIDPQAFFLDGHPLPCTKDMRFPKELAATKAN